MMNDETTHVVKLLLLYIVMADFGIMLKGRARLFQKYPEVRGSCIGRWFDQKPQGAPWEVYQLRFVCNDL